MALLVCAPQVITIHTWEDGDKCSCGTSVRTALGHGVVFLEGPEVHVDALGVAVACFAGGPLVGKSELPAFDAAVDVIDDTARVGLVFGVSSEHVKENALTRTALTDKTGDLAGAYDSAEVVEHYLAVEFLGYVLDRDEFDRFCHSSLLLRASIYGSLMTCAYSESCGFRCLAY